MKKVLIASFSAALAIAVGFSACDTLNQAVNTVNQNVQNGQAPLSNDDIVNGLKDALSQGANKSSSRASAVDGFYKNPKITIPFPPEAQKIRDNAIKLGMQSQVTKIEETLNRAAETAAKDAAPIFINAIKAMTVTDALNILRGSDTAATNYLRQKCTSSLSTTFKPTVHNAIQTVQLTKYWTPVADAYNKIPFVTPINPDLDQYVTNRAIDGLFKLIGEEEANIRINPAARATDILKKVFGSKDNPHNH